MRKGQKKLVVKVEENHPTYRLVSIKDLYEMLYHIEDVCIKVSGIQYKIDEIIKRGR